MTKTTRIITVVALFSLVFVGTSMAALWSSTDVTFLYGQGYELADPADQTIITLDHASAWTYGDNFFFFDITQPFDTNTGIYGEWHPRLSMGKMFHSDMSFGPVKDVLLASELNVGNGFRAYLYGVGFDLDIPHFNFFSLNMYIRNNPAIEGDTSFQISPAWNIPFNLGQAAFSFQGFLDYATSEGNGVGNLLTQPQLLLDVGNFQGKPGNLYVGMEYQYWSNKFGIDGIDENVAQFIAKWYF